MTDRMKPQKYVVVHRFGGHWLIAVAPKAYFLNKIVRLNHPELPGEQFVFPNLPPLHPWLRHSLPRDSEQPTDNVTVSKSDSKRIDGTLLFSKTFLYADTLNTTHNFNRTDQLTRTHNDDFTNFCSQQSSSQKAKVTSQRRRDIGCGDWLRGCWRCSGVCLAQVE